MKKFLFIAALLLSLGAFNASAQSTQRMTWYKEIPLDCKKVNVVFDYSNALIRAMSYEDNVDVDEDFEKDLKASEGKLFTVYNEYAISRDKMFLLSRTAETDYTLYIIPSFITNNGDFGGEIQIKDKDGEIVAVWKDVYGKGGSFGSFSNLVGDGYDSLAEALRSEIWRHRKKMK